jgi:hypothetical protein
MKKLLSTLVVVMALILTSAYHVNGQISVTVQWTLCADSCTTQESCQYRAEVEIYNLCGEQPQLLCSNHNEIGCSSTYMTVDLNCSCLATSQETCYLVRVTVKKQCILHGETTDICTGYGQGYRTCDQLLATPTIITTWQ